MATSTQPAALPAARMTKRPPSVSRRRERDVLTLLCARLTDLEIAERLYPQSAHGRGARLAPAGQARRRQSPGGRRSCCPSRVGLTLDGDPHCRTHVLARSANHVLTHVVGTDVLRRTRADDGARSGWTDHRTASAERSILRRGKELPMFARHQIGPAAELGHLNLLAEVSHERRLALAAARETSPGTRSGRSFRRWRSIASSTLRAPSERYAPPAS